MDYRAGTHCGEGDAFCAGIHRIPHSLEDSSEFAFGATEHNDRHRTLAVISLNDFMSPVYVVLIMSAPHSKAIRQALPIISGSFCLSGDQRAPTDSFDHEGDAFFTRAAGEITRVFHIL